MKIFRCPACGGQVYFDNSTCLACATEFAFSPRALAMVALSTPDGGMAARACTQRFSSDGCNWAVDDGDALLQCVSCRLTAATSCNSPDTASLRADAEAAKRRLLYTLLDIGIPFGPKNGAGDVHGLLFQWLAPGSTGPAMTGHEDGLISLNLKEADDALREAARVNFGEPQRTVLGHLRHEASHHLHQRFVEGTPWEPDFRALFGDERADYAQALQQHYANGAPADWNQHFVSAYASSHPWEDWAETCAHYLLMVDTVETAASWGLSLQTDPQTPVQPMANSGSTPVPQLVLDGWLPVARFLNAMSRSIGVHDSYPYLMPEPVIRKLAFVQQVLQSVRQP